MDDRLKPDRVHLDIPKPEIDWSGWESPIQMTYREISRQHEEAVEGMIWHSLNEIGIEIDKERLIAVIEGDKQSYKDGYLKGYLDGIRYANKRIEQAFGLSDAIPPVKPILFTGKED